MPRQINPKRRGHRQVEEVIDLHLKMQQINNLCIGIKLATELEASDAILRKFLTIQGLIMMIKEESL